VDLIALLQTDPSVYRFRDFVSLWDCLSEGPEPLDQSQSRKSREKLPESLNLAIPRLALGSSVGFPFGGVVGWWWVRQSSSLSGWWAQWASARGRSVRGGGQSSLRALLGVRLVYTILHPDDLLLPLHVPDSRRTESVSDATSTMSLASKYDESRRWRIITQPSGNM